MQHLHVARTLPADTATVFAVLADHAGYARLPGVRSATLRRRGADSRDGVGAERVLRLPGLTLVERITEYAPGRALGYRIIESPLPIEHLGARLLLEPRGDRATLVEWSARLRATTPVIGAAVERAIARQMALAYATALRLWARRLR
ncbi:hypothetical protein SAOR_09820 [Salinisphaera orenii MK-B5]|uniref:Polyketide cyclase n=1 Tax=Salinisphaera orenii MK-B5 TaxID=856730 RepID=A0A423PMW6_9GAMM|nr:SRPBCC family protein [Salinisphaera orenii]ROO26943.1 hypothetical protein SAOR_09820 [Salinisphaera orenii MK-B5]